MGNEKKTPIVLDDVEYTYEEMNAQQQALVQHIDDLNRKINSSQFNLDQLNIGRQACINLLKEALAVKPEEAQTEVIQ
jgi:cell division septum initiation protein DivIVA